MITYDNPVLAGFYPDPSICRAGKAYYLVTSSFEYLPGVPVFTSGDLIHWRQIGHCITRPTQLSFPECGCSGGIYAPTLRYHKGIFYMITTTVSADANGKSGNFYMTAKDPAGEWSDPIFIDQDGIDPSLFFDEDDRAYVTSNRYGPNIPAVYIQQSEIDIKTGTLLSEPRKLTEGTGGRCLEAPHLYRRNGFYYLLCAEGGTDLRHMVTVFRSKTPWGPFEACLQNPILTARDEGASDLQAAGHGDLVEDENGDTWMVFLCYRHSGGKFHHLGRETALLPVAWDESGWPYIEAGGVKKRHVVCPNRIPIDNAADREDILATDVFTANRLGHAWNTLRTFFTGFEMKDGLCLYGTQYTLSDTGETAFIARRQCHFDCTMRTSLSFFPKMPGEEAGLALRYSDQAHYELVITLIRGRRAAILRKTVYDMQTESLPVALKDGDAVLSVIAGREQYTFTVSQNGHQIIVGTGSTRLLSTEVNGGFVGVYCGMYATGSGMPCESAARFAWFEYALESEG